MFLIGFSYASLFIVAVLTSQIALDTNPLRAWTLEVSPEWDVLGPFPISAREQHFLSPSFPIDLSLPYQHDPHLSWPSSLADGGRVGWKSLNSTGDGRLLVSHPHIRWQSLRATEGWAVLQHHNVLRTTLKIVPPARALQSEIPWLAFSFRRVSFFALVPVQCDTPCTPEWHPGNIYELPRSPIQLLEPPAISLTEPTTYHLFASGDYEIRLFGDPLAAGHQEPVLDVNLSINLEPSQSTVVLDSNLDVVCDFIQGWAFGTALGVGIRATNGQWEVLTVDPAPDAASIISPSLLNSQRLAPSQTRVIPISFQQHRPFTGTTLQLSLTLLNLGDSSQVTLTSTLDIRHRSNWEDTNKYKAIRATYFLAHAPTTYLAIPPLRPNLASPKPPILALHGAGVDVLDPFWPASLPRQSHSWLICPTGRTSWGFDWHGPSADDAWGSLTSLTRLLSTKDQWARWTISNDSRTVVMGHSNGGQGTWYLATRHPDRVLAAIPAAAYIKSQQYIPLSMSRGAHFIDPSHGAILAASLAPDDNDLFLSNVVDTKILAIHGGEDENVPTWHSRELVGLIKALRSDANISLVEDPGKPHWYPDVLSSPRVQTFLSSILNNDDTPRYSTSTEHFTLTVATPNAVGSFHGFSIRELVIPGRLGKLHVSQCGNLVTIKTSNVHTFSIGGPPGHQIYSIDGVKVNFPPTADSDVWVRRNGNMWEELSRPPLIRSMGPLSRILCSPSRLFVVIPSRDRHALSIAQRLAHAMLLYFRVWLLLYLHGAAHNTKLDTEIVTDVDVLADGHMGYLMGDIIIIGSNNEFGHKILQSGPGIVKVSPNAFTVSDETFTEPSLALLFLQPHPSFDNVVLFLCANGNNALERAARLVLPIRTGVPLPEFLILGKEVDYLGVGGLRGGGFWNRTWGWNEAMAWLN